MENIFSLSEAQDSMERNIHHTQAFRESLSREKAAAPDQMDLVQVIHMEHAQLEEITEEE